MVHLQLTVKKKLVTLITFRPKIQVWSPTDLNILVGEGRSWKFTYSVFLVYEKAQSSSGRNKKFSLPFYFLAIKLNSYQISLQSVLPIGFLLSEGLTCCSIEAATSPELHGLVVR